MTNSCNEIEKFSAKAARYAGALRAAPNCRDFEIWPILSVIDAILKHPSDMICDVMAGSGHLTSALVENFDTVSGVEACKEMRVASPNVDLFKIRDASEIPEFLRKMKPSIAVSLASFHHVFEVDTNGEVDRIASVKQQVKLIADCFKRAPDLQHFLIVDVMDSDHPPPTECELPWSSGQSAVTLHRSISLFEKDSFSAYRNRIQTGLIDVGVKPSPSDWFRKVVHPYSIVGHLDCFVTDLFRQLIDDSGFVLCSTGLHAPWVFSDLRQLEDFIWEKFAFDGSKCTMDEIINCARTHLGIGEKFGYFFLGWKLGYYLVSRNALANR